MFQGIVNEVLKAGYVLLIVVSLLCGGGGEGVETGFLCEAMATLELSL